MINAKPTTLDGVFLIEPDSVENSGGREVKIYDERLYRNGIADVEFVRDCISVSHKNVLRGIHGDGETRKLFTCLYGSFYLVILNYDSDSSNFGRWEAFTLSDQNHLQVLVPPKHGNGHLILSNKAILHYKQSVYSQQEKEFTVRWDDPSFNISWPITDPVLSRRDAEAKAHKQ